MLLPRRSVLFFGFCFFLVLFLTTRNLSQPWANVQQVVGLGDVIDSPAGKTGSRSATAGQPDQDSFASQPKFVPGIPNPPGQNYSKVVVLSQTKEEDTSWVDQLTDWQSAKYVVDDSSAPLHPPANKGHEVMVYLTYIIDHYDKLPDVAVFMHAHKTAWHNDPLLNGDSSQVLRRLSLDRVIREGYMNTRCAGGPGCPDWMHLGAAEENEFKQEEVMLARSWGELFPDEPIPSVLAQPCCAQFALSGQRIRSIPRARFIFYRDWLLSTALSDFITGRVWEYIWQFVFTGKHSVCPVESVCLCDGYGFCFGGPDEFDAYRSLESQQNELRNSLENWDSLSEDIESAREKDELNESTPLEVPEVGQNSQMIRELAKLEKNVTDILNAAIERGNNPKYRAQEAGRPWNEGDGF
ncbi:hypothetical protein NUU61_000287 [Penicillium alfredii]|uniref:Uncharacterized protein n=1 Tax=Penicillium alfredii TaxID=1506179 RepID=A0A9W9G9U8_9EURO|nr:uncharacterized protein NUU61_000287 [Penicillium alfredii]KAJ5114528.1 hypothetical protein NUU61_000287 [Penicillium alfredii]